MSMLAREALNDRFIIFRNEAQKCRQKYSFLDVPYYSRFQPKRSMIRCEGSGGEFKQLVKCVF
jgi:hypothetical protein